MSSDELEDSSLAFGAAIVNKKNCDTLAKKPPLPYHSKISTRLSEKLKALSSTPRGRKRKQQQQTKMGQCCCTKKVKVDCPKKMLSPRGKSNKVEPTPRPVITLGSCDTPNRPLPSRLSVNQIDLYSRCSTALEHDTIPEEKEENGNISYVNNMTSPVPINKQVNIDEENEKNEHRELNETKNNNYDESSERKTVKSTGGTPKKQPVAHRSVPSLRDVTFQKVNRRCSHGDLQLKKSFGSGNLLNNTTKSTSSNIIHKKDIMVPTRHHSAETIFFEKRRRKAPTKENGIHNLEADQVNCYQILEEIGRGSFGAIYKCFCSKDNKSYAMKILSKKRLMRKNGLIGRQPGKKRNPLEPLYREIAILKKMDHPHIVKLVEVMDDIQVDNVYMVFELMKNGVVIEIPTENTIEEDRARRLFRELLLGIEYLHYSKIIHRDIKPSNLLLDDKDHIKIADFGVSDIFEGDDDYLNRFAGSPAFQAPEALNHDSRDKYSGKAVDVWAMGITLFCFLYGRCPFYSESMVGIELINKIKNDPLLFPDEPTVNPQAQDLISRMLSKDPADRITVLEMKEHSWVTEGGRTLLPSTEDHCRVIEVSDEEVKNSVKIITKLSSLVFAKSILKKGRWWKRHSMPTSPI